MSKENTGGPAFPIPLTDKQEEAWNADPSFGPANGMTLRDYFAAKAMQGICVSKDEAGTLLAHGYEWIASEAYCIADAMLKERDK